MPDTDAGPHAIRVIAPTTAAHWREVDTLIDELKEWDASQSWPLGLSRDEVIPMFYPDSPEDVRRNSVPPFGGQLLAMDTGRAMGCAAFHRMSPDICELYNVYVRPEYRGRGVAPRLLRQLLSDAAAAGYCAMWLETATFMATAHKLYRSLGFQIREPYRNIPERFAAVTWWMECALAR